MNIHEYQAKQVLGGFGVPVPKGKPAFSVAEAVKAMPADRTCKCGSALRHALITDKSLVPPTTLTDFLVPVANTL